MKLFILLYITLSSSILFAQDLQEVSFTTADGGKIYANYFHSGPKALVLAHGAIFNKESWPVLTNLLLKNDISVLAIDFRGYGKSTPGSKVADKYEDILAAVRFLHKQPKITQVSVLGASMGGVAAAQASIYSNIGEIDSLILLSPATVLEPEKLKGNILYIASQDETIVKSIKNQFNNTLQPKQLQLLEGNAHAQHIFKTSKKEGLTALIVNFIKNH